jgi:DNA-binding MarR family transcriptional regulator
MTRGQLVKPGNKKEIYYKLTETGRFINLEHEKMHNLRIERDSIFFSKLSEEEKATLINLLDKINEDLSLNYKTWAWTFKGG